MQNAGKESNMADKEQETYIMCEPVNESCITYSLDLSRITLCARDCVICGGQILLGHSSDNRIICDDCKAAILELKETRKSSWKIK